MKWITTPVNPNAQQEVKNVLEYLGEISGKKNVLGQHTQTMIQEELQLWKKLQESCQLFAGLNCLNGFIRIPKRKVICFFVNGR